LARLPTRRGSAIALYRGEIQVDQIELGGLRIAYRRAGSGPPLVLLHGGFGFDGRSWRPQLEALADGFTVVAWDAPGSGRSDDPPDTFRLPDYADCLASFIEALALDRPHVLGLSFGASLALELYRRHPHLPRTLVLAGAYAGWAGSLPPDIVADRLQRVLREADLPPEQWVPAYIPGMLTASAPQVMVDEVTSLMCDVHPAGNIVMLRSLAEADLRDVLPRIEVPTLLLYGEMDTRSPVAIGEALHAAIPGSRITVLAGVGHLSNVEAPDRFNREVQGFLSSATRRSSR
jgi:pimeloyl-ACP methyl ester carboxylesterase